MPLDLSLPAVCCSIFNEFLFNPAAMTQARSVLWGGDELGTGEIQITFTRTFLR